MSASEAALHPTPRKLTLHQKAVLIEVLRSFPDQQVHLCYSASAPDAHAYAQDFLTVFKSIGWTVNDAQSAEILTGHSAGLAFIVNQTGTLPPSAEALRDALRVYKIEVETFCDAARNISSGAFALAIGPPKPE
jgi:hypothetical protein